MVTADSNDGSLVWVACTDYCWNVNLVRNKMVHIYSSPPERMVCTVTTSDYLNKPMETSSKQLAMGTFLRVVERCKLLHLSSRTITVSQGKYSEAKTFYERSLAIDKRVYGADHPEVATTLNNLAGLLETQVGHTFQIPSPLEMLLM